MEQSSIERIRTATFAVERRGYDKREVDRFLSRLADWLETGGGDQAREEIVRREFERVGHHTAGLLASAQDGAEEIRREAEERAAGTRERADAYAKQTREAADQDAERLRAEAEHHARELVERAESESRRIVEEGHARRREIEVLISDLAARREGVVAEANRLADELREVTAGHASLVGGEAPAASEERETAERVGA